MSGSQIRIAPAVWLVAAALMLPATAQAQTFVFPNGDSVTLNQANAATLQVNGSQDSTDPITFTATINYSLGDQPWLSINGNPPTATVTGLTTPALLSLVEYRQPNSALAATSATISLTSTTPSGISASITVSWSGSVTPPGSGGASTDVLSASRSSVTASTSAGPASTQQVTLSNSGPDAVPFGLSSVASWLTVTPSANTVAPGAPVTLTFQFNAANLAAGTYLASVTVTNQTTGQSLAIPVTLSVLTNFTISLSPTSATLGSTTAQIPVTVNPVTPTYSASTSTPWIGL